MGSNVDATVLVFDVGYNTIEHATKGESSFFERAKKCLDAIITRKLFTKPKDEVSLLLMGTPSTDNDLNRQCGGYANISHGFPMKPINWDMLNYVKYSIDPPDTETTADWIDAIFVAIDYLRTVDVPKASKKIVLLTTFSTKVDGSSTRELIEALDQGQTELIVTTTNVIHEIYQHTQSQYAPFSQQTQKSKLRKLGETLITEIVEKSNGVICSFDEAMPKLIYFDKKHRKRVPWNADLMIGSKLTIKVAAYIYIRDEKELNAWKNRSRNDGQATAQVDKCLNKLEYYKEGNEKLSAETAAEELIKGYAYGDIVVPFEDTDEFNNGGKGLRCMGFTRISDVRDEYLTGTGNWVIVPQKGSKIAPKLVNALSNAMRNQNLAIVARYCYSNRTAPKIMILFPNTEPSENCPSNSLLMYELFYKNDFNLTTFAPLQLKKTALSDEQYDAIDELIDSMDLMSGNTSVDVDTETERSEYFPKLLDPGLQHIFRAISHRALNPQDPLLKPDEDVMAMLKPPKESEAKPIADRLKTLFPLEINEKAVKAAKMFNDEDFPSAGESEAGTDKIIKKIGTVNPAEDFLELLNYGERFDVIAEQIEDVIVNIVLNSVVVLEEKIIKAICAYREVAKQKAPYKYNEWLKNFKESLKQKWKHDFWQKVIVKEQLGWITATESKMSTISEADAEEFLRLEQPKNLIGIDPDAANDKNTEVTDDIEDLLNEM